MASRVPRLLSSIGVIALASSTAGCSGASPTWGRVTEIRLTNSAGDTQSTLSYEYDDQGRLVEVEFNGSVTEIVYGDEGPDEVSFAGGETILAYTYENGRLVERTERSAEIGSLVKTKQYTYDGDRLVEIERVTERQSSPRPDVTTFVYDDQGRLAREERANVNGCCTTTFLYDDDGQLSERESRTEEGSLTLVMDYDYEDGRVVGLGISTDAGSQGADIEYTDEGLLAAVVYSTGSFEIEYEEDPVTALPVTIMMTSPPYYYALHAPYFDHMGRSFSGVDMESLSFFLE